MPNIYVSALCQLNGYDFDSYKKMYELSKSSVLKNVKNIDDHVLITGSFNNSFNMFRHIFDKTAELALKGNNVFFVDVDMICIKQVDVFEMHDCFAMFGGWDNSGLKIASYTTFEKYFSASPRYIPSNVAQWFNNNGLNIWDNSKNIGLWDQEQVIYNTLIRQQQGFDIDKYFNMRNYNYIIDERAINQCDINDALFLHFSGSRNPSGTVIKMKEYYDRLVDPNKK